MYPRRRKPWTSTRAWPVSSARSTRGWRWPRGLLLRVRPRRRRLRLGHAMGGGIALLDEGQLEPHDLLQVATLHVIAGEQRLEARACLVEEAEAPFELAGDQLRREGRAHVRLGVGEHRLL